MSATRTSRPWIDYEWAVVRLAPRVHVAEFANVGALLHARTIELLAVAVAPHWAQIESRFPELDRATAERHLQAFAAVARGGSDAGPIGLLPPSERFHWLTAPRSAIVQTSDVHPGRSRDPAAELARIVREQCPAHSAER